MDNYGGFSVAGATDGFNWGSFAQTALTSATAAYMATLQSQRQPGPYPSGQYLGARAYTPASASLLGGITSIELLIGAALLLGAVYLLTKKKR